MADIADHICQIKRKSDGNFYLERANDNLFVSGCGNWRVDYVGIKMSPKTFPCGM